MDIFSDGGARGNPGPAACAFIVIEDGKVLYKGSKLLGNTTNNVAEYNGVILALEWVLANQSTNRSINFYVDSELIAKQINGTYKVKDKDLKLLFLEVTKLLGKIHRKIIFKNIPRAKNKLADYLVNETLDNNEIR